MRNKKLLFNYLMFEYVFYHCTRAFSLTSKMEIAKPRTSLRRCDVFTIWHSLSVSGKNIYTGHGKKGKVLTLIEFLHSSVE